MDDLISILWLHLAESTIWSLSFLGFVWLLGIRNSRVKCWLYRLCLLKFIFPSGLVFAWFELGTTSQTLPALQYIVQPVQTLSTAAIGHGYSLYFLSVWVVGTIGFLISRGLVAKRFDQQLRRCESAFNGRAENVLRTALVSMGKNKDYLRGFVFEGGPPIGLYGVFRPRIIARQAFLDSFNNEDLKSVFQHEAAHRLRRDSLWRLVSEMTFCIFWFHPLVWCLKKQVDYEMEKACDEEVISAGGRSTDYLKCLLKAAGLSRKDRFWGELALSGASLKRRIQNIIEYRKEGLPKIKLISIGTLALVLFGGSLAFSEMMGSTSFSSALPIKYLDVKPQRIPRTLSIFPETLFGDHMLKDIHVTWVVTRNGQVSHAKFVGNKPTPSELKDGIIEELRKGKWKPGEKNGKAVDALLELKAKRLRVSLSKCRTDYTFEF